MIFNVKFVNEQFYWYASGTLRFLPRIGEEVSLAGDHFVVVNIIYDIKGGTYSGQDVNIVIKPK